MTTRRNARADQAVLLDWGNTVMRVFPDHVGPMVSWPDVEMIPGAAEAIRSIRGSAIVCLATNAADSKERDIVAALSRVGLADLFDQIFCFQSLGYRKPSRLYYASVLNELGLSAERVFMVGDDFDVDVAGATAVGIRSVWLNTVTCEQRMGTYHTTVHSLDALPAALQGLGFVRA